MFRLLVSGPRALFIRPEFKFDRISYDIITPAIARNILESIRSTPSVAWHIQKIEVLNPIRFHPREFDNRGQITLCLADVSYLLHVDFEITSAASPEETYWQQATKFRKAIQKQRFTRPVMLGQVGYPANVSLLGDEEVRPEMHPEVTATDQDLGWMMLATHAQGGGATRFYRARLRNGTVEVPKYDADEVVR